MISDYRLVHRLVKLKSFQTLQIATKQKLKNENFHHIHNFQKFLNNHVSNLKLFNHCFSIFGYFQDFDITKFTSIIADFNLLVASLIPIFRFQANLKLNYKMIQDNLLKAALKNSTLNQWYDEALVTEVSILEELVNNQTIPITVINQIKVLCFITGKMFANLVAFQEPNDFEKGEQFGYDLMLFYLLDFETRQVLRNHDVTNWNLQTYYSNEQLFSYKLLVIERLTTSFMLVGHKNFNLYWRVINFVLTKSYE